MNNSDISEFTHYSELIFDAVHTSAAAALLGPVSAGKTAALRKAGGWLVLYAAGNTSEMDDGAAVFDESEERGRNVIEFMCDALRQGGSADIRRFA